jgi:DNA-binding NarL/FixJ family response regulator
MKPMAIRVILIEDHFLARMALRSVLSGRSDIVIVGEASEGASGIELYQQTNPDVTVMDLRLPGVNGFDAIAAIRKISKTAKSSCSATMTVAKISTALSATAPWPISPKTPVEKN